MNSPNPTDTFYEYYPDDRSDVETQTIEEDIMKVTQEAEEVIDV
jgi:hypothetical protein